MPDDIIASDLAARLTNVDLNLIPPLVAVLQEQSVTRAAERVGLSQPAMSHALARLRSLLHDDLLVRSGGKSNLTPRGKVLLELTPNILRLISQQVMNIPAFDPATDARRFTLGMTTSTAFVLSPLLLRIVEEHAPAVSFEILEAAVPGSDIFGRAELDLAFVADTVSTPYTRTNLYRDRWVGVVDTNNVAVGDTLTIENLKTLSHVAYQSPTLRLQPYIALAALGIVPKCDLVSSNFLMMPMLIAGTGRVAMVQEQLAKRLVPHFSLRILDLPLEVAPLGIDVVWNPRLSGDSASQWLVEALRRELVFTE